MIKDENISHFVYIKDFNRFMCNNTHTHIHTHILTHKRKNTFESIVYSVLVVKEFWQNITKLV